MTARLALVSAVAVDAFPRRPILSPTVPAVMIARRFLPFFFLFFSRLVLRSWHFSRYRIDSPIRLAASTVAPTIPVSEFNSFGHLTCPGSPAPTPLVMEDFTLLSWPPTVVLGANVVANSVYIMELRREIRLVVWPKLACCVIGAKNNDA